MKLITTEQILEYLNDNYQALTPQLQHAARYVLDNPNEVGVSSMRKLASAAGVKPNTLVRMAKALGFKGYEEFREPFRQLLRRGVETFPDRARWLQAIAHGKSHGQLFSQMAASNLANIEQLFSSTSADELKTVADLIVASKATYVMGLGGCHSLAHNFCYVASMALNNLRLIPSQGNVAVDEIGKVDPHDILLSMSFTPYRGEVVEAAALAKSRRARLVSITDSRASPIAFGADHVFVVPIGTPQFFMSNVAVVALLEALLAFMVADADRSVVKRIDEFHRNRFATGVYWTPKSQIGL